MTKKRNNSAPVVDLALQGGGAHGAFTWGVLDALLEDGRLDFEGATGASAGAMNAVVMADGWARALDAGRDPREGARERLKLFWEAVSSQASPFSAHCWVQQGDVVLNDTIENVRPFTPIMAV